MSTNSLFRFPSNISTLHFWEVDNPSLFNAPAHTMAAAIKRATVLDHRQAGGYIAEASPAIQQDLQKLTRQWELLANSNAKPTPRTQMGLMIGHIMQRVDYHSQLSAEDLGGAAPAFMAMPNKKYRILGRGIGKTIEMEQAGDKLGQYLGGVAQLLEGFHQQMRPAQAMAKAAPLLEARTETPTPPKPSRGGLTLIISR